jgi:hypothetical protein
VQQGTFPQAVVQHVQQPVPQVKTGAFPQAVVQHVQQPVPQVKTGAFPQAVVTHTQHVAPQVETGAWPQAVVTHPNNPVPQVETGAWPQAVVTHVFPSGLLLLDNFIDTNGVDATVHLMDLGPGQVPNEAGWVLFNGDFWIESNTCQQHGSNTNLSFDAVAIADAGNGDVTVKLNITAPSSGSWAAGVCARTTDNKNGYFFVMNTVAGGLHYQKLVGGTITDIATASAFTWAAGATHELKITLSGSSLTFSLDGSALRTATDTTYDNTHHKHGLVSYVDGSTYFTVHFGRFSVNHP